ncbi:MAG: hypothetical protein AAF551_03415, partial [Bacteroidota bacterium]
MKYFILMLLAIGSLNLKGQGSNLIFFAEEGENFTAYVNGRKINDEPTSRVQVDGINEDFAQVKIAFETPGAPDVKSPMMIDPGKEMTSVIKKNKKGKYVMRLVSSVNAPEAQTQTTAVPVPQTTPKPAQPTTTTSTTMDDSDTSIGISIKTGEETFSMDVKVDGMDTQSRTSSGQTATSTNNASTTSSAQISARVEGSKIILSDGRVYTFKYVNS